MNYSNFNGEVIKNYSSGSYFKGKLKRSFYALESLFLESDFGFKPKHEKLIVNIYSSSFKDFKLKKTFKSFYIENPKLNITRLNFIRVRAHNGIRLRKQRRK
jgi:hypothetical protein